MKTLIRIPLWPAACLTCVCKLEHIHPFTHHTFNNLTSLLFACGLRSDDEKTFCRALVEYTRACSHVGYPVREWRDSFPSCGTITVELLLLMKAVILILFTCAQTTAAKTLLSTETASVVVPPPVPSRTSASERTSTVWTAATVQMVFTSPHLS